MSAKYERQATFVSSAVRLRSGFAPSFGIAYARGVTFVSSHCHNFSTFCASNDRTSLKSAERFAAAEMAEMIVKTLAGQLRLVATGLAIFLMGAPAIAQQESP